MRRYGIIGRPLGQSKSAEYFSAKFGREGIEAEFKLYELPRVEDIESLPDDILGFNVTIPYKQAIIPLLDEVSEEARAIGAVNCVKCSGGRRCGYNTDVVGIRRTLDRLVGDESVGKALILGTGGASKAIQFALAERSIQFDLVSRDPMRGNLTYGDITGDLLKEYRLIVNATPVGMYPNIDEAPQLPYDALDSRHLLFDFIYNPDETVFLKYGVAANAATINGRLMFVEQAEAAWRIWNSL